MTVFESANYREFLKSWIEAQPKQGRGIARRLAEHLRISTVLMSQILSGKRELKPDLAYGIARFLSLSGLETELFLALVELEKASTHDYKRFLEKRIEEIRLKSQQLSRRVQPTAELTEIARAQFYSHWSYSAIRLLTDIEETQTVEALARTLGLSPAHVGEVLQFLVENGLCAQEGGRYRMGAKSTHLPSNSPWIYARQLQWRQKAAQHMEAKNPKSLFYTGPMVLSQADAAWARERLLELITQLSDRAVRSRSEVLACLNIDWFLVSSPDAR